MSCKWECCSSSALHKRGKRGSYSARKMPVPTKRHYARWRCANHFIASEIRTFAALHCNPICSYFIIHFTCLRAVLFLSQFERILENYNSKKIECILLGILREFCRVCRLNERAHRSVVVQRNHSTIYAQTRPDQTGPKAQSAEYESNHENGSHNI